MAQTTWPPIRQRTYPNGTAGWMVDCRFDGRGGRLTFKTKAEAQTAAEQARIKRRNEGRSAFALTERERVEAQTCIELLKPFGKTLRDATEYMLPHLRARQRSCSIEHLMKEVIEAKKLDGKSTRYLQDMRSRLGQFAKAFPGQKVGDVTTTQVETWLRGLKVASLTRNNFRRVLLTSFNLALERGYCLENPAAKAAKAKQVETPVGILSVEETVRLLGAAPPDMVPILAIGAFAGLRRAELERLEWSDINLPGGFIEIKAAKAKSARRRIIKIQPNLREWLTPFAHESGLVTQGSFQQRLVSVRSAAGIKE